MVLGAIVEIEKMVRGMLSEASGLPEQTLFDGRHTLAGVIEESDVMVNSIDVMETFARISNRLKRKYGVEVEIGGISLGDELTALTSRLMDQLKQMGKVGHVGR